MTSQRAALLELLRDDDPATIALLKEQLTKGGVFSVEELRALHASADDIAAVRLADILREIERREADGVFEQLCRDFGDSGDLENAVWRLAAAFLPGEDFQRQKDLLDAWGQEVRRRLQKAVSEQDCIETLVEYLSHDLRFHGNEDDYYNLTNSLLPEIIEMRRGIPITLSLIYIFVGRRAGLNIQGVGLPGHFIIRYGDDFFDPFHGGRRLGLDECRALIEQHGQALAAKHLLPIPPRLILLRMLNNIYCLAAPSDEPLADRIASWMDALGGIRTSS